MPKMGCRERRRVSAEVLFDKENENVKNADKNENVDGFKNGQRRKREAV